MEGAQNMFPANSIRSHVIDTNGRPECIWCNPDENVKLIAFVFENGEFFGQIKINNTGISSLAALTLSTVEVTKSRRFCTTSTSSSTFLTSVSKIGLAVVFQFLIFRLNMFFDRHSLEEYYPDRQSIRFLENQSKHLFDSLSKMARLVRRTSNIFQWMSSGNLLL